MDRDYADNEGADGDPRFEHALFVKSRVISANAVQAVIDAGHKAHALDSGPPQVWGRRLDWANAGDEHGRVTRPAAPAAADGLPALGDTVWLVPGHCDPTVNLHDELILVSGGLAHGQVETIWPIHGRGRLR
jgi:D-serine deaminase-like pyridoxal phosphate-dependent protein